jgi:threonine dehydratase
MPQDAPVVKKQAVQHYGAEVLFYDRQTEDRTLFTEKIAEERNLTLIPPYDHPSVIAGAGTVAYEILAEQPELDCMMTPVGGGGLISGTSITAHGFNPKIMIYGVEPEQADDTRQSLQLGKRVMIAPPSTIADGLRLQSPGELTFPIVQQHVTDILTVSEAEILQAVKFALLRLKLVIEPSGAVPLAAILFNKLPKKYKRVGLVISGGNIDPPVLTSVMEQK